MNESEREEIIQLTQKYGGDWGLNHTRRLLNLVACIGEGLNYDADAVWTAAHLHDWGAYAPWAQEGIDHAERSVQVAAGFLAERSYPENFASLVLECIEFHHKGNSGLSLEAVLLSDADALDFLGVVGVLRDFSKAPKQMRKAFETTQKRSRTLPAQLCLEKSKEIARERVQQMEELLAAFRDQSFGQF